MASYGGCSSQSPTVRYEKWGWESNSMGLRGEQGKEEVTVGMTALGAAKALQARLNACMIQGGRLSD